MYKRQGWLSFGSTYYYLNEKGVRQTGWQTIDGNKYYFNKDGVRQIGWQDISGKRYYFMPDGHMHTGWVSFGSTYYYMMPDGHMHTGWLSFGSTYYYSVSYTHLDVYKRQVCWLPYFLTLYPGVITWDSEWQVEQALGLRGYSNHQPWIQTLVIKFCCFIGGIISDDVNTGVAIYVILQMCILAGIYSYFIYYLYQKGTRKLYLAGCLIFYAIFPINAFYAVTMWKDVIMGAIVLLFSLVLWKMQRNDQTKMDFVLFFVLGVLISLLRSNGFYAYLLCIPFMILFLKRERIRIGILCILSVGCVLFVKGPVMNKYNVVPPDTIESLSCLLYTSSDWLA